MQPFNPLDPSRAARVHPLGKTDLYTSGPYITPGTEVTVTIDSREQELAILAAHDYGIECLSTEGREQLEFLVAQLKVAITGR